MTCIDIQNIIFRRIVFDRVHPIVAWRNYYCISASKLSSLLEITEGELEKLERSNGHLKPDILEKLSKIFSVPKSFFEIRFLVDYERKIYAKNRD